MCYRELFYFKSEFFLSVTELCWLPSSSVLFTVTSLKRCSGPALSDLLSPSHNAAERRQEWSVSSPLSSSQTLLPSCFHVLLHSWGHKSPGKNAPAAAPGVASPPRGPHRFLLGLGSPPAREGIAHSSHVSFSYSVPSLQLTPELFTWLSFISTHIYTNTGLEGFDELPERRSSFPYVTLTSSPKGSFLFALALISFLSSCTPRVCVTGPFCIRGSLVINLNLI